MNAHSLAEIHKFFLDAFNGGDVEALVALYEPNDVLLFISVRRGLDHAAICSDVLSVHPTGLI